MNFTDIKSAGLHLAIVMNSTCLPANNGGRIDPWARAQALKSLGCRLTLITWEPNGKLPESTEGLLRSVFEEIFIFGTGRGAKGLIKRLANLWRASPHVSSRFLSQPRYLQLTKDLDIFCPDAILLDGLYGGSLALKLSGDLEIPFFYRSHNIEHRYMSWQAKQASTLRSRLAWSLALTNLKIFETEIQLMAQHVFDISLSDMDYWRSVGVQRNSWLPTLFDESDYLGARSAQRTAEYDIAFVGNLSSPNNQQGVRWLLSEVLPLVRRSRPNVSCLIAGKNPPPHAAS